MITDFSLPAFVNAASGALFLAVGLFCLALGRRSRRAALVGATALAFGIGLVGSNLVISNGLAPLYIALDGIAAAGAALLTVHTARGLPVRSRRLLAALATLAILTYAGVLGAAIVQTDFMRTIPLMDWLSTFLSAPAFAFALLGCACALRFAALPVDAARERRALACLTLAFGLFAFVWLGVNTTRGWNGMGIVFTAACFTIPVWLVGTKGADARLARNVLLALVGAAVVGLVVRPLIDLADAQGLPSGFSEDYGLPGVARLVGLVFLVRAIVRHDLLGVPLPHLVITKGPLAATALATLFIVAQLMQNFLSAEYGLLAGGVLAGAVLFAANPVQKAIERATERTGSASAERRLAQEESYRKALRMAVRDRKLTRAEETTLHELAHDLGISGPRAHALLAEAENEPGRKGRGR